MGQVLRSPGRRTVLALAATFTALAIPCCFWYIAGSREAEREAVRLEAVPHELIRETGERLSSGLSRRLETLREAESRRPYYHYQNLYHDPQSAAQGASVLPSPLSQGPSDPLVQAHFQIRSNGQLTLPTLNEEGLKIGADSEIGAQAGVQKRLQPAAPLFLAALESEAALSKSRPSGLKEDPGPAVTVQKLKPDAWVQNATANTLYPQLQQSAPPVVLPAQSRAAQQREVTVRLGAFGWHTVAMAEGPRLVALRRVETPDGLLAQGFLIASREVSSILSGAPLSARFLPGQPRREGEYAVALGRDPWHLSLEVGERVSAARAEAAAVRMRFRRTFWIAMLAVALAAMAVPVLVRQSEQLARDRSDLAAVAAHELRTPLAGLRLYGEMLAEGRGDPARSREYAGRVAAEAERLGRVVSNLLGFARLERRALSVRPEQGDLGEAIRALVERQRPALEAAGIRVEVAIADDLPPIRFDRDALSQILLNLLDNVEKHARSSNGRVIRLAASWSPPGAAISVADNGPGLAGDPFRRFSGGRPRSAGGGLGLGLGVARALARAHGGELTARNAPGGGAIVTVFLPAAAPA